MNALCTPTIATAAIFVSLLFVDLLRHDYELLPGHAVAGVVSVLLMGVLCEYGASLAAWGLLLLPFVILLIGWIMFVRQPTKAATPTVYSPPISGNSCSVCRKNPCGCYRIPPVGSMEHMT
jgi:hypothetical protein